MHLSFDLDRKDLDRFHHPRFEEGSGISDFDELQRIILCMADEYKGESRAMTLAKITEFVLQNAAIEVRACDPFGVNLAGWEPDCKRYPWRMMQSVIRKWELALYQTDEGARIREKLDRFIAAGAGWGYPDNCHSKPNWDDILALGLVGLRDRAIRYRDEWAAGGNTDAEQRDFYESVICVYNAFIHLIGRFRACAQRHVQDSPKMPYTQDALRSLESGAPKNLYEVMLLTFLYSLVQEYIMGIQARTLGNVDTLWYPYYRAAIDEGSMTREEVKELVKYFYMQYEMEANLNNQPVFFAGTDGKGGDLTNELTYLMLEAYGELSIISPKLQISVAQSTPDALVRKCCELIRDGHSSIVFGNEEVGRAAQRRIVDDEEELSHLSLSGCYNYSVKENIQPESTGINLVKGIELVFYNGIDPNSGYEVGVKTGERLPGSFEEFYERYLRQVDALLDTAIEIAHYFDTNFDKMSPTPLLSGNFESALASGKDFYYNGSRHHNTVITASCIGTVADSLYAIEKYVYQEGVLTIEELKSALAANWAGYEDLRKRIASDTEKYGNNLDAVDRHAATVLEHVAKYVLQQRAWRGDRYSPDCEGIDHGIRFGKLTGATPDGRFATAQLSKNLQSVFGCDRRGLLAYLHSVTKIDATLYPNGAPIDFVLHPSAAEGEDGLDAMVALIRETFKKGGSAIHGNVYSAQMLRDAQAHPEKYSGLQVRLCGWSQYFNKLSRDEQDMLIRQAETA